MFTSIIINYCIRLCWCSQVAHRSSPRISLGSFSVCPCLVARSQKWWPTLWFRIYRLCQPIQFKTHKNSKLKESLLLCGDKCHHLRAYHNWWQYWLFRCRCLFRRYWWQPWFCVKSFWNLGSVWFCRLGPFQRGLQLKGNSILGAICQGRWHEVEISRI